ncbi:hypothetical protein EVAR_87324_1 [Eumeta japonica]|uniref:Helitron helicase-like domain-containing protein n=1 Tax=Eumeta variegata TaxID=151549 RepID=A0A4C1SEC2_EUMVA|nr:hypothetical protein EVAR_87324_1 [Eumeta japonica]
MVTGEQFASRDIVLQARDDTLTRVPDTHKFYDALQYPIIFSKGQEGYHFQVPQINPVTGLPLHNKKVSCMDFYAYNMMIRENNFNIVQRCKQLANQFYVDMYVKVESERLRYISLNQTKLRAENYIHLQDAVANDANLNPNNLGRMVILPSSFVIARGNYTNILRTRLFMCVHMVALTYSSPLLANSLARNSQ